MQAFSNDGSSANSGDGLSGGVIAGLAVVGALVLGVVLLLVVGLLAQKKARRGGTKHLEDSEPAGLSWSSVGYMLPAGHRFLGAASLRRRHTQTRQSDTDSEGEKSGYSSPGGRRSGKLILDNVTGSLPYGGFMAIMGPSGAGKS